MSIELKSKSDIEKMRRAGLIVFEVLQALREMVAPGVTTKDLDRRALELTREKGARPAFLNYPSRHPDIPDFPATICASPNDVIVHGIPNDVPLNRGDIVSIDFGCEIQGFFGDSAITVAVGEVSSVATKLMEVTAASLEDAIEQCRSGNRIGDISAAVQKRAEAAGLGIVREFVGHGIGASMHEPPRVPNFGNAGQGRLLRPGMALAIEPMVTVGAFETKTLDDGWTAVTKDGSLSAHFEHTVVVTDGKPYVLTRP